MTEPREPIKVRTRYLRADLDTTLKLAVDRAGNPVAVLLVTLQPGSEIRSHYDGSRLVTAYLAEPLRVAFHIDAHAMAHQARRAAASKGRRAKVGPLRASCALPRLTVVPDAEAKP